MDFSIIKTKILNSKRTFRTPFKVTSMCFSPQNDLIALGSKTGEVMMKRTTWKMIWKTNVSMVPAVGTECKTDSSISALHFSPDGRYIAAATSKGLLHLLDVETGKVRYSVKASSDNITKFHWDCIREKTFPIEEFAPVMRSVEAIEGAIELAQATPDITREEIAFVYQRLDEDGSSFKHDETQKENLERTLISPESYRQSLRNTILLATDGAKIIVLVAGVFPYMEIDVSETIQQYNQGLVFFYDMHYSSAFCGVSFIATTYGPFLECKQRELKPPGNDPKRQGQGCHTLLFNVKLDIDSSLWDAALRYTRLLFGFNLYSISLDTTKRNWTTQVANLHARFDTKTKAVKIGDVLLEILLSGSTDAAGEAFLERGLGTDGLEGIKNFASKHMPEVSRLARGQLASAARNLCFQRCEFITAMQRYEKNVQLKEDDNFLYEEELPSYLSETNAWLNTLEEKINILDAKTRQLGIQCLTMMQELGHLTKWISITKPFAKTMKVNALMKIKRMNIAKILLYIVNNFIPDQEAAKDIKKRLFHMKELIKEQEKKEKEENFEEVEYLEKLENIALEEQKKLAETYRVKFKFSALSDEDDAIALKLDKEKPNLDTEVFMDSTDSSIVVSEEEQQAPCDLDRVGSFFEKELSMKAIEVLPKFNKDFDDVMEKRGSRMNSEEVQKMGLMRILEDLANILSSPHKVNCDKAGNMKKPEVLFVYEIASDATHQGYVEAKISNVTPSYFKKHEFNNIPGMGRSIQITVIEKNLLKSIVLVPTGDIKAETEIQVKEHTEAMNRNYNFEKVEVKVDNATAENRPPEQEEAMEVDCNELRIDVDLDPVQPQYDTLAEYSQIHPLRHGELVIMGKFKSSQEGAGVMSRMMRSISSYPHQVVEQKDVFAVQYSEDGKTEVTIETMIVHPTTQLAAYLHDEGSKITIGDLKPEVPTLDVETKKTNRKTFRDYQRRRERYREDMGVVNLNDVQYDVLVQEAMDSGRDLTGNGDPDEEED